MKRKDVFTEHRVRTARRTLAMNPVMARVMGGMTREDAEDVLRKHGGADEKASAARK